MVGNLLPESIFGIDTDDIFAYTTTKKVRIRDRHVGLLFYTFSLLAAFWVLGYQILWNNEHFQRKDVVGMARMLYSHPTKDNCDANADDCAADYIDIEELPYCSEYKGTPWPGHRHCQYADLVTAVPGGEVDNKLFFPTSVEIVTQKLVDGKYVTQKASDCINGGYMCHERAEQRDQFFYVADIKSFTIQFTSSYDRGGIVGTSLENPGSYWECAGDIRPKSGSRKWSQRLRNKDARCKSGWKLKKIPCLPGVDCSDLQKFDVFEDSGVNDAMRVKSRVDPMQPFKDDATAFILPHGQGSGKEDKQNKTNLRLFQRRRNEAGFLTKDEDVFQDAASTLSNLSYPGQRTASELQQFQNSWGDVFNLGRLLELAGADLDNDYNIDGWTTRQSGTAIEVSCVYDNLHPLLSSFGYKEVQYTYHMKELNMPYVSRVQLAAVQPEDYPLSRRYEVKRGVIVIFRIAGQFGIFNVTYLLIMLTTALALLATANSLTDFVATYVVSWGANFFHHKYEVTPDFSDMWVCEKCGWHNIQEDATCKGIEAWECPLQTPVCGAPRPRPAEVAA